MAIPQVATRSTVFPSNSAWAAADDAGARNVVHVIATDDHLLARAAGLQAGANRGVVAVERLQAGDVVVGNSATFGTPDMAIAVP